LWPLAFALVAPSVVLAEVVAVPPVLVDPVVNPALAELVAAVGGAEEAVAAAAGVAAPARVSFSSIPQLAVMAAKKVSFSESPWPAGPNPV